MGIFSRLTDIVNSNINALLDRAEDPQKMIRLIINEMEETLVEVRSSSAKILADKKQLLRRLQAKKAEAADWAAKAKLALSKDREDLAKGALIEKQSLLEQVQLAQTELTAVDQHLDELSEEVDILQSKINDAKAKQKAMQLRAQSVENRLKVKQQSHKDSMQKAFEKLEGFERKMDVLEGELESYDFVEDKDLKTQFEQMENDEKVQSELDALKKELQQDKEG